MHDRMASTTGARTFGLEVAREYVEIASNCMATAEGRREVQSFEVELT
jgi:hypothetical protein